MRLSDQIRLCTCSKRDHSPARCLARISVVESMLSAAVIDASVRGWLLGVEE